MYWELVFKTITNVKFEFYFYNIPFYFQSMFFFLAQTEQGDIFKITLDTDEDMVRLE